MLIALWVVAVGALILAVVALIDSAATRNEARQAVKDLDGVTCRSLNHESDMRKKAIDEVATNARVALAKAEGAHARINAYKPGDWTIKMRSPRDLARHIAQSTTTTGNGDAPTFKPQSMMVTETVTMARKRARAKVGGNSERAPRTSSRPAPRKPARKSSRRAGRK